MKVSVEGRRRLEEKIDRVVEGVELNVNRAVAEAGEDLLRLAIPRTPMSAGGGRLRQSGYVDHSPGVAEVGFEAPYAVYVHEMGHTVYPDREVTWTTPGTEAKFLEGPFNENSARYAKHIKDAARRATK
jgi:hypothetical protein